MSVRPALVLPWLLLPACLAAQEFQPPASGFSDRASAFPYGSALDGLRIVVSPGHGWEGGAGGGFQRELYKWAGCGACEGIREDLLNAELCTDHLVPMLRQAGARVYVARQVDRQPIATTADDGEARYAESGPWQQGASPALGFQGDYRALHAPKGGRATWTLDVPAEGDYWVHARWAAGANRCPDARFTVAHAGGTATFVVDQRIDGSTWIALGRFRFPAGPAVVALEPPGSGDCHVIADAIRLGGGTDPTSGRPWWQVSALQWQQAAGTPGLGDVSDVTVRPALANALGADLFVSIHADAGGTTRTTGSSTYRHNCLSGTQYQEMDPADCDRPPGSASLQYALQDRIVADLRAGWDQGWVDRGRWVANFGELRVLDGIPGALVEAAFFDGTETAAGLLRPDNRSLHDPRFRRTIARAIVRGIIDHAAPGAPFPPDPPTHLVVRGKDGVLHASWRPVAGAAGYRVFVARDGRGYDDGTRVEATGADLPGVAPGRVALVRVTALHAGGESTASEAIAASADPDGAAARILVINAFDRLDPWVREDRNRHDHSLEHGLALAGAGHAFDGAADEAVRDGDAPLGTYAMADWLLGRESSEHETFSAAAQALASGHLDGGGCLVASGTEIAWDLGALGTDTDRAFLAERLGAAYAADDAGTRGVAQPGDGPFAGLPAFGFGGVGSPSDAPYPDVLEPAAGGAPVLAYAGGDVAAIVREGPAGRSMLFGFPIEAIDDPDVRVALMDRIVRFCGAERPGDADGAGVEAGEDAADAGGEAVPEAAENPPDLAEEASPDAPGRPDVGIQDVGDEEVPPIPDAAPDALDDDRTTGPGDEGRADRAATEDLQGRDDAAPDVAMDASGDLAGRARTGGGCTAGGSAPGSIAGWMILLMGWAARFRRRQAGIPPSSRR